MIRMMIMKGNDESVQSSLFLVVERCLSMTMMRALPAIGIESAQGYNLSLSYLSTVSDKSGIRISILTSRRNSRYPPLASSSISEHGKRI